MTDQLKIQELEQRVKRLESALLLTQTVRFNTLQVYCRLDFLVRVLKLNDEEIEERIRRDFI